MQDTSAFLADSLVGQVLASRFRLQRVVQLTSNVATFEGVDQQKKIPVRIHVVTNSTLKAEQLKKIKHAAGTIRQIGAIPGVIGIISGGVHNNQPFLVTPMLPGVTLGQKFEVLSPETRTVSVSKSVKQWLPVVAAALDGAHNLGVCHGTLSPDSIATLANGSAVVDGLPLSHLLATLELTPATSEDQTRLANYQAPEIKQKCCASPAADQYALASIIAEAIGKDSDSVKRAVNPSKDQRHRDCSAFAAELIAELAEGTLHSAGDGEGDTNPLELAPLPPEELAVQRIPKRATADLGYELEIDDRATAEAVSRQTALAATEEDLSDLTFTRVKQQLLSGKSAYDKGTDLQNTRASWRRIAEEYASLSTNKRTVTKLVAATLALLVAIYLLQLGWRGAIYVTSAGTAFFERVSSRIPKVDDIKMQGELAAKHMRDLWDEHVTIATADQTPEGSIVASPPPPQGEEWPTEEDHVLSAEDMSEPKELIEEILGYKGEYVAAQGIGVFHVDNPTSPDVPLWIGGFGLPQGQPGRRTPLLHGTLLHQAEDGTNYTIRYLKGDIQDFWIVSDGGQKIVHANFTIVDEKPVLNGAAVVIDTRADACLALDYSNGELRGAQWCTKDSNSENANAFKPPQIILPVESLTDSANLIGPFISTLDASVSSALNLESQANAELRKYARSNRIR